MKKRKIHEIYQDYINIIKIYPQYQDKFSEINHLMELIDSTNLNNQENFYKSQKLMENAEGKIDYFFNFYTRTIKLLEEIDSLITNYYKLDFDGELYQLNAIEQDLINVKNDFNRVLKLKNRLDQIMENSKWNLNM
jgi:hypothetical protein